jgi:hypothetical protein
MQPRAFQFPTKAGFMCQTKRVALAAIFLFSRLLALAADPSVSETPAAEAARTQRWLLLAWMALLLIIAGYYVRHSPPGQNKE